MVFFLCIFLKCVIIQGKEGVYVKKYNSVKSLGILYILLVTVMFDSLLIFLLNYINSYELSMLIKVMVVVFTAYQVYHIGLNTSLRYGIDDENLYIIGAWGIRKVTIPLSNIEAYKREEGQIKAVKISGYGSEKFAIGKFIINKIGLTHAYITSNEQIIYLKTNDGNFGISPENYVDFVKILKNKGIEEKEWTYIANRGITLYKDKKFMLPFVLTSVVALIITLTPCILYLKGILPVNKMPVAFNAQLLPIEYGTGKQFAMKQMSYGLMNMAILFCMYYAAYFYAKYDKRSAYKFMYIALIVALAFLFMQLRILLLNI